MQEYGKPPTYGVGGYREDNMNVSATRRVARRGAALAATSLVALGIVVGVNAPNVSAAPKAVTIMSVNCPGPYTYGSSVTCHVEVRRLFSIGSTVDPTGTVTIDSVLNRLSGSSCTLGSDGVADRKASCDVTVSAIDTGAMAPYVTYGGDSNYFGTFVWGVVWVDPATLTITPDDDSRGYGEANPSFTVTYDSFKNGDDETDLGGSLECLTTADGLSVAGDYPITCSGLTSPLSWVYPNPPHYDIVWEEGTLTVGKIPLTITADNAQRLIGEANPSFVPIFAGFIGDDDETDLTGTMECTTAAHVDSPVGEYDIEYSGMTSDNYDITYHNGTLKVLGAPGAEVPGGDAEVKPGEQVEIDVHDWMPGSTVIVNGCGIVDGEIVVDENGDGHGVFTVPADVNTETCEITLTGQDATDNPAEVMLSLALAPDIPQAGSDSLPIGRLALLVMLAGIGLVVATRRRAAYQR